MSWFSSNTNKPKPGNDDDSARTDRIPASWRDEKVEDPFDDPKVRKRISELIIRSVIKPSQFGV